MSFEKSHDGGGWGVDNNHSKMGRNDGIEIRQGEKERERERHEREMRERERVCVCVCVCVTNEQFTDKL